MQQLHGEAANITSEVAKAYARYGPLVYSSCRRLLRDEAAAQDATQEVFVRFMRQRARILPDSVPAWLRRVATNYCLNQLRNARRSEGALARGAWKACEDFESTVVRRDWVGRLLARTRPEVATSSVLHFAEGLGQGEVARRLGVSRRTVLYRLARLAQDARELAESEAEEIGRLAAA